MGRSASPIGNPLARRKSSDAVIRGIAVNYIVRAVALTLVLSSPLLSEGLSRYEEVMYRGFRDVKSFGAIWVRVREDAEKIGLRPDELADLVKLRYKNNFAGLPFKKKGIEDFGLDDTTRKQYGFIDVEVWVVGDDYPIAYHIELDAGTWAKPSIYTDAALGYGNKSSVPKTAREIISGMVERLAIKFFAIRGEL